MCPTGPRDSVEVIPFDSHGFTGRREIGGSCEGEAELIVANKPGAITVNLGFLYRTSDQAQQSEEDRAAAAAAFETALATFEWTGRPYDDGRAAVGDDHVRSTGPDQSGRHFSSAPAPTC